MKKRPLVRIKIFLKEEVMYLKKWINSFLDEDDEDDDNDYYEYYDEFQ